MADITVTAASVAQGANASTVQGFLGATVTAGQVVYRDSADSLFKLADGNSATAAARAAYGIALNGGASGQPVVVQTSGDYSPGATVTVGGVYVLSATAGGIAPVADLASGNYTNTIGIGITASTMRLIIATAGVAVP